MKHPPEAYITESLFDQGIGRVIVSRFKAEGAIVESGVFLVDLYCLGVKNGFFTHLTRSEYENDLLKKGSGEGQLKRISPSCARKLIEGAVAYAQNLGLAPHPDYKRAARVLGGIVSAECTQTFTYGQDGKPFYIQGPNETAETARRIIGHLTRKCGKDNFHFMIPLQASSDDE